MKHPILSFYTVAILSALTVSGIVSLIYPGTQFWFVFSVLAGLFDSFIYGPVHSSNHYIKVR